MAKMYISTTEMVTIASDIDAQIEEWNAAIQTICTLQQEMDGMWDGAANDAFNQIFAEDKVKFDKLTEVMRQYSAAIKISANNYNNAEDEIKGIVIQR